MLLRQPGGHGKGTEKSAPHGLAEVEQAWHSLVEFEKRATPQLATVGGRIDAYLGRYDKAYEQVDHVLEVAHKKREEAEKWEWALNILVGTALGFAGGFVFEEAGLILELAKELVIKSGEEGLAQAGYQPKGPDYALPKGVNNNLVGRNFEHELRKGWEAVGLIGAAGYAFSDRRDALRDAQAAGRPTGLTDKDLATVKRLSEGLAHAETAFARFVAAADTPVLERSELQIERDLWVAWMSQSLTNAATIMTAGVGDEEDNPIGARMQQVGVSLDVWEATGWSAASPDLAAKKQMDRLAQLGRIGVVVVPPYDRPSDPPLQGAVHVRADAYQATGRVQPEAVPGAPEYVAIVSVPGQYLRSGEVVILADTVADRYGRMSDAGQGGGLIPRRLGATLPVSQSEREAGVGLFGRGLSWYPRTEPEVVSDGTDWVRSPERARMLVYPVNEVVRKMRDVAPGLVVRDSEDGVLVSEADGTAVILFTAYVSYQDARSAGGRTGARRVVAVDLNPQSSLQDYDDGIVLMTKFHGAGLIEAYIHGARAQLGREQVYGPVATPPGGRR